MSPPAPTYNLLSQVIWHAACAKHAGMLNDLGMLQRQHAASTSPPVSTSRRPVLRRWDNGVLSLLHREAPSLYKIVPFEGRMLQDPATVSAVNSTEPCATFCATNLKGKVGAACRAPWPSDECSLCVCSWEQPLSQLLRETCA